MGPPPTVAIPPELLDGRAADLDADTRQKLEAAAFRRLVAHLRARPEVQNIDLMNLSGFCRNCLGKWYAGAAVELGLELSVDDGREVIYGMPYAEWKARHQAPASSEQLAGFAAAQKP